MWLCNVMDIMLSVRVKLYGMYVSGIILGMGSANERRRYKKHLSLAEPIPRMIPMHALNHSIDEAVGAILKTNN